MIVPAKGSTLWPYERMILHMLARIYSESLRIMKFEKGAAQKRKKERSRLEGNHS